MVKIGRIKNDQRHFAVEVAAAGNVTEWTADESKAKPVELDVARKVASFYAGRRNAGRIIFGDEKGRQALPPVEGPVDKPMITPGAPVGADAAAAADRIKQFEAANAALQKTADTLRAEAQELRSINEKLRVQNQDLDQRLTLNDEMIKELEAANKKLKVDQAAAVDLQEHTAKKLAEAAAKTPASGDSDGGKPDGPNAGDGEKPGKPTGGQKGGTKPQG